MTEDFDKDIRSILGQLIGAREDQHDADKRLHDYRTANTPRSSQRVRECGYLPRLPPPQAALREWSSATRERPEESKEGVRGRRRPAPAFPARGCTLTLHLPR